jgi:hypothetical protein
LPIQATIPKLLAKRHNYRAGNRNPETAEDLVSLAIIPSTTMLMMLSWLQTLRELTIENWRCANNLPSSRACIKTRIDHR